ncbi:MAG: cobalt ECF transporter T component CbiQ [Nitrolancea sp.]
MTAQTMPAQSRSRRRKDFVAKTISGVTEAIERSVYTEEFARRDGLLQRVDPRVKVGVFVAAVLTVGLARSLPVILILYAAALLIGLVSKLPASLLVKRILIGIPMFAGIVALPALFLIGGKPLLDIGKIGPVHLAITSNSVMSFIIFISRVAASVTLAALLVVTTRWSDLLKSMRVFRVPEVFIVVLGMTYRYIFLLLKALENLFLARASRTVGQSTEQERRRWIGASMGTLLGKSFKTSNDVYQAMVARGFTGDVRTITNFAMRDEDWLFVAVAAVVLASALLLDMGLAWS